MQLRRAEAALDVSVVIPTLNAAGTLSRALSNLDPVTDCVVVDGGSEDGTIHIAEAAGTRLLHAPRGRGNQLAVGIAAAIHPWLLLLHADTRLSPEWREAARDHMAGGIWQAGWFRFALDSSDARARVLEHLVDWRCRTLALPYGDQGLLIHRELLEAVGGIRCLPLMEDVDLIRRLGRRRLIGLDADAITSAARWQRDGWLRRSARNQLCLALYLGGVPPRRLARFYG